jgi:hypothetical protein
MVASDAPVVRRQAPSRTANSRFPKFAPRTRSRRVSCRVWLLLVPTALPVGPRSQSAGARSLHHFLRIIRPRRLSPPGRVFWISQSAAPTVGAHFFFPVKSCSSSSAPGLTERTTSSVLDGPLSPYWLSASSPLAMARASRNFIVRRRGLGFLIKLP